MRLLFIFLILIASPVVADNGGTTEPDEKDTEEALSVEFDITAVDIGRFVNQLACGCRDYENCPEWLSLACGGLGDIPEIGPFFEDISRFTTEPVAGVCSLIHQPVTYGLVLEEEAEEEREWFSRETIAYVEAARTRMDAQTYYYYFRFSFSPQDEYDRERVNLRFRESGTFGQISDFPTLPAEGFGDTFVATHITENIITEACMVFTDRKDWLPREICARVVEV